jgi:acyl carrier protein
MSDQPQRQEIFDALVVKLSEMFEVEADVLTLETHLFEDLDLDSIDAIDLAVQLQEFTGRKVNEEVLRGLRTVSDIVELVLSHRAQQSA